MKKRIFALVFLCLAMCLVMCACVDANQQKLDQKANATYSKVELTILVTVNGQKLNSKFTVKNVGVASEVEYTVEEFATISESAPAGSYKVVKQGSFKVERDKIVEQDGETISKDLQKISTSGLNFKTSLQNAKWTETSLSADVVKPADFMGVSDLQGCDMHVNATFGDYLQKVNVTYTDANGAAVELIYVYSR